MQNQNYYESNSQGFKNESPQQRENKRIEDYHNELRGLAARYRRGGMSESEYREKLEQSRVGQSALKNNNNYNTAPRRVDLPYDYKKNGFVKTEKGWGLANNDPYGYYKKQREERSAVRKEKLAPFGETFPKDYKYLFDNWQKPMYSTDFNGNKSVSGWGEVPEKSYINQEPSVQTPQFNF
tara:strand:- start:289 stop:831 length:543 start_codon:yes stop_codon:yes gene_type:complete